jgi:hypothetical protein
MTTIVTRVFAKGEQADGAMAALRKAGFSKQAVGAVRSGSTDGATLDAIRALGVYEAGAKAYAAQVKGGATLVVVHAPFAKSYLAMEVMDDFDPIASDAKHTAVYVPAREPRRIMAETKALPTLLNSNTLVLSDGIFPPAVIRNAQPFDSIIRNTQPKAKLSSGTFSEKLGLPLLTRGRGPRAGLLSTGTPFSSTLRMPVLSSDK